MVARADTSRLTPSGAPSVAAAGATLAAAAVAIACLVVPTWRLESAVVRSGVAAMVNAAAPPLGFTARSLLALGGGALAAVVTWAVLVLVTGDRRLPASWSPRRPAFRLPALRRASIPGIPSVRRADSHPDAPPRPPILAERDLGVPFLSIVAPEPARPVEIRPADERPLPADLDTALAAIDPAAIPDVPREPVRPVAPLAVVTPPPPPIVPSTAPPLAPGERIDSIELGADVRDQPETIESLLARLERGARRRPAAMAMSPVAPVAGPASPPRPDPEPAAAEPRGCSLEETLGSLRRPAARG